MNPPSTPPTPAPSSTPAAPRSELLTTRPPAVQSILRLLMAVGGAISILLGLLSYEGLLPSSWAIYTAAATLLLNPLLQGIRAAGDLLDNGQADGSFKIGGGFGLLLAAGLLLGAPSCASERYAAMTDGQLALAEAGVATARVGLLEAERRLAVRLADPDAAWWESLTATLAADQARQALTREEAKLAAARAARAAQDADRLTSAKQAAAVLP